MNTIIKTVIRLAVCVAFAAMLCLNARAQSLFTNATGGDWNTAANWSPNAVPDVGTNAILSNAVTVTYTAPMAAASFTSLFISNNGTVTVSASGFNVASNSQVGGVGATGSKFLVNSGGVAYFTNKLTFVNTTTGSLDAGGSLTVGGDLEIGSSGNLGANFTNNGGNLVVLGGAKVNRNNTTASCLLLINGGSNYLGAVSVTRSVLGNSNFQPIGTEGLVISNGVVNMTSLNSSNGSSVPNSVYSLAIVCGGTTTNSGALIMRMGGGTLTRAMRFLQLGGLYVQGGVTVLNDMSPQSPGSQYSVLGGTNFTAGFQMGSTYTNVTPAASTASITNAGNIYVGSSGMTSNGSTATTLNVALNNGGLFGATASWGAGVPMIAIGSNFIFRCADVAGTPFNIALSNGVSGAGTLIKDGGGTLTFLGANTYSGTLNISNAAVSVGNGGSVGQIGTGPVSNYTTLLLNRSDAALSVANAIAGPGNVTNIGAGTVTLSGASTYSGLTVIANGTLSIGASGSIPNSSTIIVNPSTTFNVSAVSGGFVVSPGQTLLANGSVVGSFTVGSGGTLKGTATSGINGPITVLGTEAPGASIGTIGTGPQNFPGGGTFEMEIDDATGTSGTSPGWDKTAITGGLNVTATPGSQFKIKLVSLSGGSPGNIANFVSASTYTWTIVTTTEGITNFNSASFGVDSSSFSNSLGLFGAFRVITNNGGNDLAVEYFQQDPNITDQPDARTNNFGTTATFSVAANSSTTAFYKWRKNGVNLTDGGNVSGSDTTGLTVSSVTYADGASYDVYATNTTGAVTSSLAVLTVIDPIITSQPTASQTNCVGSQATFTVGAAGSANILYQWRKNGVNLTDGGNVSGATSSTLTISPLVAADSATYSVKVIGDASLQTNLSANAVLTVANLPGFSSNPVSRTNSLGDFASFSAAATNNVPFVYQWQLNGVDIAGATTTSLIRSNITAADAGSYALVATANTFCSSGTTSAVGVLTIVGIGKSTVALWNFNSTTPDTNVSTGVLTPAVGSGTLTIVASNGSPANAGFFTGSSSDPATFGGDNSDFSLNAFATTNINKTSGIRYSVSTLGWTNIVLSFELRVSATASRYYRFQYSTDGSTFIDDKVIDMTTVNSVYRYFSNDLSAVAGVANNPNFAFRIVSEYESTATGGGGAAYIGAGGTFGTGGTFREDMIHIFAEALGPVITLNPQSLTNCGGSTATFSVAATGNLPLSYQWNKNGSPLSDGGIVSGATTTSLTLTGVGTLDEASYTCVVTNLGGSVTSAVATLTVIIAPSVTTDPTGGTFPDGSTVTLSTVVSGTAPISYQWRKNGADVTDGGSVSGALTDSLTISPAGPGDSGSYELVVSNSCGSDTSAVAVVTVSCPTITVSPPTLPNGVQYTLYSAGVSGSGSSAVPYTYTAVGILPDGVVLNSSSGGISGIASNSGPFVFDIVATDTNGCSGTQSYSLSITSAAPDTSLPTVKFNTTPPNNAGVTTSPTNITGTAKDVGTAGIQEVVYSLNGGPTNNATTLSIGTGGNSNWTASVAMVPGTNSVTIQARDKANNLSTVASTHTRKYFLSVAGTYTLAIIGDGTVAGTLVSGDPANPGTSGAPLKIGRKYTVTATAGANYLFTNWTISVDGGPTTVATASNKYSFTMSSNVVLSANFITNNFIGAAGTYYGLYNDIGVAHQSAGWFTVKTDSKQKFSGKLLVQGEVVAISGTFNQAGHGTLKPGKVFARKGLTNYPIVVALDLALDGSDVITGTVTNAEGWEATMSGDRATFSLTSPATNYLGSNGLGQYTFVYPGSLSAATEPGGDGYGLVQLGADGKVKPTGGRAGDYHLLKSTVTSISKNGAWPFYAPMYVAAEARTSPAFTAKTYKGSTFGWLYFSNNTVSGDLFWNKVSWTNGYYNSGFTNTQTIIGSGYIKPPVNNRVLTNVTTMTALLADGNLVDTVTNNAYLALNNNIFFTNAIPPVNPRGIKGKVSTAKGEFSGSFTNSALSVKSLIKGVVLQDTVEVRGVFLGTNNSGSIRITP